MNGYNVQDWNEEPTSVDLLADVSMEDLFAASDASDVVVSNGAAWCLENV